MATLEENILCKKLEYGLGKIDIQESVNFIIQEYQKNQKEEIVIINIGTDKCIGDSFGPMFGSLMELKESTITYYGTLEEPLHALNMDSRLYEIYKKHPNAFVIGVDASLGENINNFVINNKPIQPGRGIGKDLPSIGDMSIKFITHDDAEFGFFSGGSIRSGVILKATKELYEVIYQVEKILIEDINIKNIV